MSDEIIKGLDALAEKFGLIVDWTSENVIPYIEQLCGKYINYEFATSVVWLIFGIIIGIIGFVIYKYVSKEKELGIADDGDCFIRILIYFGIICIFVTSVVIVMNQVFDIVTCFTFPEKIIIDELKNIIKKD